MSSVSVGSLHAAPSSVRPETTMGKRRAIRRANLFSSNFDCMEMGILPRPQVLPILTFIALPKPKDRRDHAVRATLSRGRRLHRVRFRDTALGQSRALIGHKIDELS